MAVQLGWPFYVVLAVCGLELASLFIATWIALDRTWQRNKALEELALDAEARSTEYTQKPGMDDGVVVV